VLKVRAGGSEGGEAGQVPLLGLGCHRRPHRNSKTLHPFWRPLPATPQNVIMLHFPFRIPTLSTPPPSPEATANRGELTHRWGAPSPTSAFGFNHVGGLDVLRRRDGLSGGRGENEEAGGGEIQAWKS
jgi:hypothetical protein